MRGGAGFHDEGAAAFSHGEPFLRGEAEGVFQGCGQGRGIFAAPPAAPAGVQRFPRRSPAGDDGRSRQQGLRNAHAEVFLVAGGAQDVQGSEHFIFPPPGYKAREGDVGNVFRPDQFFQPGLVFRFSVPDEQKLRVREAQLTPGRDQGLQIFDGMKPAQEPCPEAVMPGAPDVRKIFRNPHRIGDDGHGVGKPHVPVVFHFLVAGDVDAGGTGDVFPVPQGEHEFLFPAAALQRLGIQHAVQGNDAGGVRFARVRACRVVDVQPQAVGVVEAVSGVGQKTA